MQYCAKAARLWSVMRKFWLRSNDKSPRQQYANAPTAPSVSCTTIASHSQQHARVWQTGIVLRTKGHFATLSFVNDVHDRASKVMHWSLTRGMAVKLTLLKEVRVLTTANTPSSVTASHADMSKSLSLTRLVAIATMVGSPTLSHADKFRTSSSVYTCDVERCQFPCPATHCVLTPLTHSCKREQVLWPQHSSLAAFQRSETLSTPCNAAPAPSMLPARSRTITSKTRNNKQLRRRHSLSSVARTPPPAYENRFFRTNVRRRQQFSAIAVNP